MLCPPIPNTHREHKKKSESVAALLNAIEKFLMLQKKKKKKQENKTKILPTPSVLLLFTVNLEWKVKWPALLSLFIMTLIFSNWSYGKINAYEKTKKDLFILGWVELLGVWLSLKKMYNVKSRKILNCDFLSNFIFTYALRDFVCTWNQEMRVDSSKAKIPLNLLHEWFSIYRSILL